jgi:hypothetical protein
MEWDPNEWQGRSRKQVETNNKVTYWAFVLFIFSILIALILS